VDAGGGYTYLDPKKGHEFSAALGFTYNFENPDTDYQNGIDVHLDWAASQFFSETFHAGLVGYFYNQLTGDDGAGAVLGDFKSRVAGIGPQAGWFIAVGQIRQPEGFLRVQRKKSSRGLERVADSRDSVLGRCGRRSSALPAKEQVMCGFHARIALSTIAVASAALAPAASAQENADVLAKQLSNPVASLISVPLQYNVDFDIGPENGTKHYVNVQPVIPYSLSEHTNLITRVIAPVIYQDDVFGDSGSQFGLGDITPSFFFSPKEPVHGWIVAAGPVFLLPTATDELLGTERWGAGPTALALKQTADGWTYGALVNHPSGRTLTVNVESTYDWKGSDWNVPVNLVYSKVTKVGSQMLSYAGGVRYFAETPGEGPEWGLRLVLTLLFPEK
jgi:hypothetical protein